MKKVGRKHNLDLAIILVWPIIATIISFLIKANALLSIIFFLVIPSIYLSIKGKEYVKKAIIFTLASGLTTIIIIDYTAQISKSWLMYPNSIIPYKLFGLVTLEVILWALFTCYFIIMFYEYFIDKHRTKKLLAPNMKYLLILVLISFSLFIITWQKFPSAFNIPYYYLQWGIILLLIPFLFQLLKYPKTTSKFFLAAAYFFYMNIIYEISALKLGWWTFPGVQFVGWIKIFGVSFPIEEVIFWFILLALTTISYYEFFDDDEK